MERGMRAVLRMGVGLLFAATAYGMEMVDLDKLERLAHTAIAQEGADAVQAFDWKRLDPIWGVSFETLWERACAKKLPLVIVRLHEKGSVTDYEAGAFRTIFSSTKRGNTMFKKLTAQRVVRNMHVAYDYLEYIAFEAVRVGSGQKEHCRHIVCTHLGMKNRMDVWPPDALASLFFDALSGDAQALVALGDRYAHGYRMCQNDQLAKRCYKRAAKLGNDAEWIGAAQYRLGGCYELGLGGNSPKPEKGWYYYMLAVNNGCVDALGPLAECYQSGTGTQRNVSLAKKYYRCAGEAGFVQAYHNLGCLYEGEGDHDQAYHAFRTAAKKGVAESQLSLGIWHEEGNRHPQSLDCALRYYAMAARQANVCATRRLWHHADGNNSWYAKKELYACTFSGHALARQWLMQQPQALLELLARNATQ